MNKTATWYDESESKTVARRLHKIDDINNGRIFTLKGENNPSFYDHWFTLEDFNEYDHAKVVVGASFYEHIRRVKYRDGSVAVSTRLEFEPVTL